MWCKELLIRGSDPVGLQVVGDPDLCGIGKLEQPLSYVTIGGHCWIVMKLLDYALQYTTSDVYISYKLYSSHDVMVKTHNYLPSR